MIRAADLMPLASTGLRPAPALRDSAETLNPSSWFDGDGLSAATRIGVELGAASRGLSVAQHAERVLAHLCGDPADGA
ncbi:hypothetical protein HLB44_09620 [Aquincola sp. S2]|uniref:Uncharacterized protein n=1 Tax=Pseudaquabacterium terrae TaxID=2732868 RepID=A0ABX2EF72_9BURK|nr:hypothetical protein [Aquabacterium terrae]NRF67240.1 hypothetical protein [Aquabacterium terrae]